MTSTAAGLFATYVVAATLLTITPGLDTALILRVTSVEGRSKGFSAALGVGVGCLVWGTAAAFGIGALVATSTLAYDVIRFAGAAYLLWLGCQLLFRPGQGLPAASGAGSRNRIRWFLRGVTGNITNPKIGIFYASFLPQFCPPGYPTALTMLGLTLAHVVLGLAWAMVLIALGEGMARFLKRPGPARWIDRVTGGLFVGFGVRLALEPR